MPKVLLTSRISYESYYYYLLVGKGRSHILHWPLQILTILCLQNQYYMEMLDELSAQSLTFTLKVMGAKRSLPSSSLPPPN